MLDLKNFLFVLNNHRILFAIDELLVAPTTYDECSELLKSIGV